MKQLKTKSIATLTYFPCIFFSILLCSSFTNAAEDSTAQNNVLQPNNLQQASKHLTAASTPLHEHSSVKPVADVLAPKPKQQMPTSVPEQNDSDLQPKGLTNKASIPETAPSKTTLSETMQKDDESDQNDNKIVIVARPQIAGLWGMTIPDAQCIEYYNFMENGDVVVKSGKEWSYGKYLYQVPAQSEPGSPVLVMQIKYDNLQTDCSGNAIDQRGEQQQQYVKWTGSSSMEFCGAQEGKQCFASLKRVLP